MEFYGGVGWGELARWVGGEIDWGLQRGRTRKIWGRYLWKLRICISSRSLIKPSNEALLEAQRRESFPITCESECDYYPY